LTQAVQTVVTSLVGAIRLVAQNGALVGVYFSQHSKPVWPDVAHDDANQVLLQAAQELSEYFAGQRRVFNTPLEFHGTDFQRSVWQALIAIPFGEQRTYSQLAVAVGQPQASRAVGAANGRNPLSIFVPCHRVVGMGGKLTGYAGGVDVKRWLLAHEQKVCGRLSSAGLFD
jgi:methylated-DNA-[protein]-cysteine S-methyltransferase